jgi:hypothetical protein
MSSPHQTVEDPDQSDRQQKECHNNDQEQQVIHVSTNLHYTRTLRSWRQIKLKKMAMSIKKVSKKEWSDEKMAVTDCDAPGVLL